jgi:hypothetical protein
VTTPKRPRPSPDPEAPPSVEEIREAEELRLALDDANLPHEGASLARSVELAHAPRDLGEAENRRLVESALSTRATSHPVGRRGSTRAGAWASAGLGTLAAAAAIWLFLVWHPAPVATGAIPLLEARSTQPLFQEPFTARSGASRIDRIASARAYDLRENRFARWKVR